MTRFCDGLKIEEKLRALCAVKTEDELISRAKDCATEISHITQLAAMKQGVRETEL